jgi:hypothetical protein
MSQISGVRHVVVASILALCLASSADAGIKNRIEFGIILIEIVQGSPAALVGLAASANQGLEKTISYPFPRLTPADTTVTVPLFLLNADVDDSNNRAVLRALDTLVFLTNTSPLGGGNLVVHVTFRNASGVALNSPVVQIIEPTHTAVVSAITTLNP